MELKNIYDHPNYHFYDSNYKNLELKSILKEVNYDYHYFNNNIKITEIKNNYSEGEKVIRSLSKVRKLFYKHFPRNFPWDNHIIVSGSFLLKILLRHLDLNNFPDTDIDIFVDSEESLKNILIYFHNMPYTYISKQWNSPDAYNNLPFIKKIYEFHIKEYKYNFQIICVEPNNNIQRSINTFDLSHNQVLFDGKEIKGNLGFLNYLKYQISIVYHINPARILKSINLKISLCSYKDYFYNYPKLFKLVEKNKFVLRFNKLKFDEIKQRYNILCIEKIPTELIPIESKYYNSQKHLDILQKYPDIILNFLTD